MPKRDGNQPQSGGEGSRRGPPASPAPKPPQPAAKSAAPSGGKPNSRPQALLVVTGADHPGILDDISHYVGDRGAAIEAVRVVNLRGRFALIMLVAGKEPAMKVLAADLQLLCERTGVRATMEPAHDPAGGVAGTSFALSAAGGADADESATLRELSNLLRVLNINIRDVDTKRTPAGGFEMRMEVDVPRDVPVSKLRELVGQLLNQHPLRWELSAATANE